MMRVLQHEQIKQPPAASARLSNPTEVLVSSGKIYASEFRQNRVVFAKTATREGRHEWRVFADRGPHCRRQKQGGVDCAILDGPWGLACYEKILFIASFGSDQVLAFSKKSRRFLYSLGSSEDLDSPEGLAIIDTTLYVASFLDSRIVAFDLTENSSSRTIFSGDPIDIDYNAGIFISASSRQKKQDNNYLPQLRGPEQLLAIQTPKYLLVSSLHNDSVLLLDPIAGALLRADLGNVVDGSLGMAHVPSHAAHLFRYDISQQNDLLLLASYRDDDVFVLDLYADPLEPGLAATSLGLLTTTADDRHIANPSAANSLHRILRGPAALALDPANPASLYVACYESGSLLFFNLSSSSPHQHVMIESVSSSGSTTTIKNRHEDAKKEKRRLINEDL
eukprot:CAMPEP_0197321170 /NCGR_PEP_ID=MMETSP0891-20130614/63600_1 /TAXON_ID=44058 ORGANISM="Aureoumbra lagunensis, Strain CCMP1510" /NCGR_SAMPLE_ID=MMETSP0891 /ASSEMBLY_ACC=CAM_ASM_000534 /LENGTH=392 /DNA_ID=CAMNT_0042812897 /DNA_START=128 /DNA_END=1306 /DNA_ORIENTATION=-